MSKPTAETPAIDWDMPVDLVHEKNLPEQVHEFDSTSALAIQAALGAKRPLLVRGKPGVGKTQLAKAAAKKLGRPLVSCVVDSRTEARDLLYEFDAVMRLAEAQIAAATASARVTGNPAASADKLSAEIEEKLDVCRFLRPGPLWWAFHWRGAEDQARLSKSAIPTYDEDANPENGCVVLIDEIDKAETDVPNGLLEALGSCGFPLPGSKHESKLRVNVVGEPPLVIITTNEERVLPPAFLRRCLVLRLELPEDDVKLIEFLRGRAELHFKEHAKKDGYGGDKGLFFQAAELLVTDRKEALSRSIEPLPGQAEYLDLIRAVLNMKPDTLEHHKKVLNSVSEFAYEKQEPLKINKPEKDETD